MACYTFFSFSVREKLMYDCRSLIHSVCAFQVMDYSQQDTLLKKGVPCLERQVKSRLPKQKWTLTSILVEGRTQWNLIWLANLTIVMGQGVGGISLICLLCLLIVEWIIIMWSKHRIAAGRQCKYIQKWDWGYMNNSTPVPFLLPHVKCYDFHPINCSFSSASNSSLLRIWWNEATDFFFFLIWWWWFLLLSYLDASYPQRHILTWWWWSYELIDK